MMIADKLSKFTIMVVDDSKENLRFIETVLQQDNYQVHPTPSGKLALRALEHIKPDLILLDINMPKMNGLEVCKRIRKIERFVSLPIIFMSGLAGEDEQQKVTEAGGTLLIAKPFRFKDLLETVQLLLESADN